MNRRPILAWAVAGLLLAAPTVSRAVDDIAAKERVGVRAGGVATLDELNDAYGNGWGMTLFFTERIARPLLLDIRLGALYLGDLKLEDLDDQLTNTPGIQGSMRLLYVSVGPMLGWPVTGSLSFYGSAGAGIYSVSMEFEGGLTPFDLSDQYFGFNGGLGLMRRLSGSWSIEAYSTVHYFLIEESIDDLYFAFTDGAGSPLLIEFGLGITVDLR